MNLLHVPFQPEDDWTAIAEQIGEVTASPFRMQRALAAAGGCINSAVILEGKELRCFVKLNRASRLAMFEAEAAGLAELAGAGALRVPRPLCWGADQTRSWLVLEYLHITRHGADWGRLGAGLADLHRHVSPHFGWKRDNTIGATLQINARSSDWVAFWRDRRLGFQLQLAERNCHRGRVQSLGAQLLERLGDFFTDYRPTASLLHGDLWSGNAAFVTNGEPVIFDPAVYYGDRETDLAMSELFGGFPPAFHSAYRSAWPLDAGYSVRRRLYQLYHLLNHLNLFGSGYRADCEATMAALLSDLR